MNEQDKSLLPLFLIVGVIVDWKGTCELLALLLLVGAAYHILINQLRCSEVKDENNN